MTCNREVQLFADDSVKSPKLFSLKLTPVQNINKSLSSLRPISRNDDEIGGTHESIFHIQPPTYQQFGKLDSNSSVPFWNQYYVDPDDGYVGCSCQEITQNDELPARSISTTTESQHLENEQLRNGISSAHRSVSGFSLNQSEGNRNESNTSSNREKRKLTRQYFVSTLSICYAIFLVVFGTIVFIGDMVGDLYPIPQAFCIYMLSMAFVFFLYLYIDIRLYVSRNKKQHKDRLDRKQLVDNYIKQNMLKTDHCTNFEEIQIKEAHYKHALHKLNLSPLQTMPHKYCFQNGGSFYLKLGASWFAFGLLVYSALQISYDVYFIASNGQILYECASYITLALNILFPIYSLFSLFFIVKYMNVIINWRQSVARIFLLHAIGTSIALWIFAIIRETVDAIAESDAENDEPFRSVQSNDSFEFVYNDCGKSIALNAVHHKFAPYLYPFVIEYCILIVGIYCNIYANINQCPRKKLNANELNGNDTDSLTLPTVNSTEYSSSASWMERSERDNDHNIGIGTSSYIYADCQSSFHGIFVGLLLAIMTIVFVILMFVGFENRTYLETSIMINNIFECSVLVILIFSTIFAYMQTIKLDVMNDATFRMDEILLLMTIPAFFMDFIFSIVPAITNGALLPICIPTFRLAQVLIQTPFLIDGIRRCSNSKFLQKKKIGRGFIIFLAIANMSIWIYNTFSSKTISTSDFRYTFYGYILWNILNHISLPLIMFYRFHASVLLIDIWNHAYKSERKHQ